MYRSTYSLSLSYGAASRACGEDRESNAVRRSLRIVAQGDPLLLGRGVRRCICPGRLAFPRPRALPLFRAPALASRRLAGMLVDVAAGHGRWGACVFACAVRRDRVCGQNHAPLGGALAARLPWCFELSGEPRAVIWARRSKLRNRCSEVVNRALKRAARGAPLV